MTTTCLQINSAGGYRKKYALYLLVVSTRLITGVLSLYWHEAGSGQYLSLICAYLIALSGAFCASYLCRKAKKPLFDAVQTLCGKAAGKLLAGIFLLFLLHSAQNILFILANILAARALPSASALPVILIACAVAFVGASCGVDALGRFSRLSGQIIWFILILSLLLPAENYHLSYLFPFFGHGADRLITLGICASADFFGILLFALSYDPNADSRAFSRAMFFLMTAACVICLLFFLSTALMFPYSAHGTVPLFDLLSVISAGRRVQTLTSLFSFLWTGAFLVTSSAQLSFCFHCTRAIFPSMQKKSRAALLILACVIALLASLDRSGIFTVLSVQKSGWLFVYPPLWLCALFAACRKKRCEESKS